MTSGLCAAIISFQGKGMIMDNHRGYDAGARRRAGRRRPWWPKVALGVVLCAVVAPSAATATYAGAQQRTQTTAPVIATDPSGQPMPIGNLPGWRQVFASDFANETYPVGSFTTCSHDGCAGTPTVPWGAAADGTLDTSGHCEYYPSQTLSVSGGIMNVFIHTASDGVCMTDDLHPVIPGYPDGMTYGMYTIRFRAAAIPGYKLVDLFWPVNEQSGEIDFPEDQDLGAPMMAFFHQIAGGPNTDWFNSEVLSTGWNTATVQWTPTSVAYMLNGTTIGTVTTPTVIPQTPMYVDFDSESQERGAPKPLPTASGTLQIAWATVYAYDPVPPVLDSVGPSTLGTGAFSTTLTLTGQFMPASTVTFSNRGITAAAPPRYVSPSELTVPVDVAPGTALGPGTVTVTDVAGTATCSACLTIDPGPLITGVNAPAVAGSTVPVTVTGKRFSPGLQVDSNVPGMTFSSPTVTTSSHFTVNVTAPARTLVGDYDLTVTDANPDTGTASCSGCLHSVDSPAPPAIITVAPHDGRVSVNFTAPTDDGGQPITSYSVNAIDATDPSRGGQIATGTRSPIVVTGLTNGDVYRFRVVASNGAALSKPSAVSAEVIPSARPQAPLIGDVQADNGKANVNFLPRSDGGLQTSYTVTAVDHTDAANGGQVASGWHEPLTVKGLTDGDTYTFVVTATNADGTSRRSTASIPVIPATIPGAPVITSVTAGDGQVSIVYRPPAWDGGLPIMSYSVTVDDLSSLTEESQTVAAAPGPIAVTGLTTGDAYRFVLRATNAIGTGSGCVSARVVLDPK